MNEQKGRSSKRRRVEGQSLTAAVASTSTAGNAPRAQSRLKKKDAMTPTAFRKLLLEADNSRTYLIMDAREVQYFKEKKLKFAHCVNAPVIPSSGDGPSSSSGIVKFESRREVITILEKYCPELLPHLRRPGDYTHIVIFDDKSTAANCSKSTQLIHDALTKWNESTKISILVLEGGFTRFSQQFPKLIVTSNDTGSPEVHVLETPTITEITENDYCADLNLGTVSEFLTSLEYLDQLIVDLRKLITLKAKIIALETLKQVLNAELKDEEDKLTQMLETSTPDSGRCPICYEVFRGEILQCLNGHSICSNCCERLNKCPKCRWPYGMKVRNRALEELLENAAKAECICGVMCGPKEVESHVHKCVKKGKIGVELKKVKSDLDATKLEFTRMLGVEPRNISERIADSEGQWYSKLYGSQKRTQSTMKKLWDYRSAKKNLISSLEQTLFSMSSSVNP